MLPPRASGTGAVLYSLPSTCACVSSPTVIACLTLLLDVATRDARLVGGVDHHRLPDDAAKTDAKATALNRQESELRPHHLRHTITSGIRMIV